MILRFSIYIISCFFIQLSILNAQSLRLNEIQASNTEFIDEDKDTPDWIEIYNYSTDEINLEGWSLTDNIDNDTHWTFPNTLLQSGEYMYLWASGKNRTQSIEPRSLVREDDTFKYIVPNQNFSNAWKYTGFDDSNWLSGIGGFGYGDGDDQTLVPNGTEVIFIRKEFHIDNIDLLYELYLDIDYDDAFVAYINGEEVARNNIDDAFPNYLSLANTDKEAQVYNGGIPDQYNLSNIINLLQSGNNTLAIQVHNNNSNSSDLTLRPFLSGIYNAATNDGSEIHPLLGYQKSKYHTDFKISSEEEIVYLLDPNGTIHNMITISQLPTNTTIGYSIDNTLKYFATPTPGFVNDNSTFEGSLDDDITFSSDGGQVDPLSLSIGSNTPFTSIRYTTDATEPNENSVLYSGPIEIGSSTTIRARLFRADYIPSQISSRNFIIGEDHLLPVISLVTDPKNLFDEVEGIYSVGNRASSQFPFFGANFWEDIEKPIHVSYYGMDNELKVELNAGVKIFGGWSRAYDQRSLSIFARKKYDPSDIEYSVFDERNLESYGAIVLRNAGNDNLSSNMRDILNHELIKDLDIEAQAYQTVAAYINDEYWGLYNMREKVNEHFLANKFGLDPDDIDLLEFEGIAVQGSNAEYLSLLDQLRNENIANDEVYESIEELIDIDNLVDYFCTQIYIDNSDWPGNNIKFWKHKNGKWRWILYDSDFAFNLFNEFNHFHNTLSFALNPNGPDWPNPPWSTELFRELVKNESFRIKLVNRFADFMNSRFTTNNIINVLDQKIDELQPEILRHFIRWNGNMGDFFDHTNRIRAFANQRPNLMKSHIRGQFGLPGVHELTISNAEIEKGFVSVSTLDIVESEWRGDYFEDNPFQVTAIAKPGYAFSHWTGSVNSNMRTLSINITNAMNLVPHFEVSTSNEQNIVINEINYKSEEIADAGDWIELYNPNTTSIDIDGWYIKDENENNIYELSDVQLEPNGYSILVSDQSKFSSIYPNINFISTLNFGLSSDDQVRLYDINDQLIDSINYTNLEPWPTAADGQGYTLELISPELDNSLAENFGNINLNGSPGRSNTFNTSADVLLSIENISLFPNPASQAIHLSFLCNTSNPFDIEIFNASGNLVKALYDINCSVGRSHFSIETNNLNPGEYNLVVKDYKGKKYNKKWIKI